MIPFAQTVEENIKRDQLSPRFQSNDVSRERPILLKQSDATRKYLSLLRLLNLEQNISRLQELEK